MAWVEEVSFTWKGFGRRPAEVFLAVDREAEPDRERTSAADDTPEQLFALWHESIERARANVAAALETDGLDQPVTIGDDDQKANLRRPAPQAGVGPHRRWVDPHPAVHRPAPHLEPGHAVVPHVLVGLGRVDPQQQPTAVRGGDGQVSATQEGEAPEHRLLDARAVVRGQHAPDPVGEVLVVGHRARMPCQEAGATATARPRQRMIRVWSVQPLPS